MSDRDDPKDDQTLVESPPAPAGVDRRAFTMRTATIGAATVLGGGRPVSVALA